MQKVHHGGCDNLVNYGAWRHCRNHANAQEHMPNKSFFLYFSQSSHFLLLHLSRKLTQSHVVVLVTYFFISSSISNQQERDNNLLLSMMLLLRRAGAEEGRPWSPSASSCYDVNRFWIIIMHVCIMQFLQLLTIIAGRQCFKLECTISGIVLHQQSLKLVSPHLCVCLGKRNLSTHSDIDISQVLGKLVLVLVKLQDSQGRLRRRNILPWKWRTGANQKCLSKITHISDKLEDIHYEEAWQSLLSCDEVSVDNVVTGAVVWNNASQLSQARDCPPATLLCTPVFLEAQEQY